MVKIIFRNRYHSPFVALRQTLILFCLLRVEKFFRLPEQFSIRQDKQSV
ncbi:MAG: hypothetical protein IJ881_08995 [Neisseriaceae bacterium]|nr:hypothetical protein [Neisseriaceae bacterium]MBR2252508.1 hypothetical protein [Neisseriaceae bacterium]MBR3425104.1 hypothetical protein [Neisseriaceae bacterium]